MTTAFCPGPNCQKMQPLNGDRCGYCGRRLEATPQEVAAALYPEGKTALEVLRDAVTALEARVARLERPAPKLTPATRKKGKR